MANYPYLERCAEAVAQLGHRTQDLASRKPGKRLGASDNYRVQSIGEGVTGIYPSLALTMLGSIAVPVSQHLALKMPRRDSGPLERLIYEVAAIDEITRRAPKLAEKMPAFMGLLAVDGADRPLAIITEDATRCGSLPIEPMPASPQSVHELKSGFGKEAEEAVGEIELENSVAFDVGGTERWLDFTPSPVYAAASLSDPITVVKNEVRSRQNELTVLIPDDSVLAEAVSCIVKV
ncbi:MAG TPA: hypothetical protein VFW77_02795 [Candidatus Saccharimonadales bacterium]|nr:hypothetical protein [Candidatus Saccharimonadales bacterium]